MCVLCALDFSMKKNALFPSFSNSYVCKHFVSRSFARFQEGISIDVKAYNRKDLYSGAELCISFTRCK